MHTDIQRHTQTHTKTLSFALTVTVSHSLGLSNLFFPSWSAMHSSGNTPLRVTCSGISWKSAVDFNQLLHTETKCAQILVFYRYMLHSEGGILQFNVFSLQWKNLLRCTCCLWNASTWTNRPWTRQQARSHSSQGTSRSNASLNQPPCGQKLFLSVSHLHTDKKKSQVSDVYGFISKQFNTFSLFVF